MPIAAAPSRNVLVTLVAAVLIAACGPKEAPPEPPRAVRVVKVEGATADAIATYTGDVRARYESALGFRIAGKLAQRLVEIGQPVRKGQPLAKLDAGDQELGIAAARQQVAAADANATNLKNDLVRFRELRAQGFISAAELDRRQAATDVAIAQLAQAKAQLGVNANQADYTTLRADADGVVTSITAEVGQVLDRGQLFMRVARVGEKEVAVAIPENRVAEFRGAKALEVSLWAMPERRWVGRLRELAPAADPVTRTYLAKVTVVDAGADVDLGMTATVKVSGDGAPVVKLPSTALFQKGDATAVWVVDPKANTVNLKPVKVERFHDTWIGIADGLSAGDQVVRAGVHKLFAGQAVRVLPEVKE